MLQNAGNVMEIVTREVRFASSKCHLRIDAPCAGILLRWPGFIHPVQRFCAAPNMQNMPNVSARVLNLAFAVADAVAVVVALVFAVCLAFGARWITAQGE